MPRTERCHSTFIPSDDCDWEPLGCEPVHKYAATCGTPSVNAGRPLYREDSCGMTDQQQDDEPSRSSGPESADREGSRRDDRQPLVGQDVNQSQNRGGTNVVGPVRDAGDEVPSGPLAGGNIDQSGNTGGVNVVGSTFRDLVMHPNKVSWWVKAPVIIGLLALIVSLIVGWEQIARFFDPLERQPPAATATIVNTGVEGATLAYPGPDDSPGSKVSSGGFREGQSVEIICQVPDGRLISDDAYPGGPASSSVWDRVQSTGAPLYVPDIYTDLPKGEVPPVGVPIC
jgi:hypothetical protein